jgi:hypothetical protein
VSLRAEEVFVFVKAMVGGFGADAGSVGWGVGVVVPEMWGVLIAVGTLEVEVELGFEWEEEEVEEERSVRIARRKRSLSGIVLCV